jgi:hypothetical protein
LILAGVLVSADWLLQVWLMERVKRGMKPLWGIMQFASACVLWMPMYLIGFAFWIR